MSTRTLPADDVDHAVRGIGRAVQRLGDRRIARRIVAASMARHMGTAAEPLPFDDDVFDAAGATVAVSLRRGTRGSRRVTRPAVAAAVAAAAAAAAA